MTTANRLKRDLKLATELCQIVGTNKNGSNRYPSLEEVALRFNLCASHVFRIKKNLIGLDAEGTRKLKEEYEPSV